MFEDVGYEKKSFTINIFHVKEISIGKSINWIYTHLLTDIVYRTLCWKEILE